MTPSPARAAPPPPIGTSGRNRATREDDTDGVDGPGAPTFRPDVDGLRAVAIAAVVLYHARVPFVSGGFVGVDVFFVISGWLITRNLVARTSSLGGLSLRTFWSRRVKRLVPALVLVLAFVAVGTVLVITPLEWAGIGRQSVAASLYLSNIEFARIGDGYFAASVESSPVLHTWSLGVEEQFYVVWPLLFVLAGAAGRRRTGALRRVLVWMFVATTVVSLAVSIVLSTSASSWAFFGLPSRAWEFALAGLLAVAPLRLGRSAAVRVVLALGGLASIAVAALTFTGSTPYPSYRALLPVLGTLAVIAAADGCGPHLPWPSKVLATPVMQWFGRVSYSWYLWHWPFIVFAFASTGSHSPRVGLPAALVALGVGAVCYRYYENPVRFSERLRPPGRAFLVGGAMTLVGVLCGVVLVTASSQKLDQSPYKELAAVRGAHLADFECERVQHSPSGIEYCELGRPDAPPERTVLLAGDSHARQWQLAFGAAAERQDMRMIVRWLGACPDVPVDPRSRVVSLEDCEGYRAETDRLVDELGVRTVVLAQHPSNGLASTARERESTELGESWREALDQRIRDLEGRGITVGVVLDDPLLPEDPIECLAGQPTCTYPRAETMGLAGPIVAGVDEALRAHPGVVTFDGGFGICDEAVCRTAIDGTLVYADSNHLSRGYTEAQEQRIAAFLSALAG
jgi:peptidoglycan/LPS O-acetylase OafA/YrhL